MDPCCWTCEIPVNQIIHHYSDSNTARTIDTLARNFSIWNTLLCKFSVYDWVCFCLHYLLLPWFHSWALICDLSFDLEVHTSHRNSETAEETLHTIFPPCGANKKCMTYKMQHWKILITLHLNTKLSSGTLAKYSIQTTMCQQQGSTQTSPLIDRRWTFSWTCYRNCIYLSQNEKSHGWRLVLNIAASQKGDLYFSNWFIKPQQHAATLLL